MITKSINILLPIKTFEDIEVCNYIQSKAVYVNHKIFLNDFKELNVFIENAEKNNCELYICFDCHISEDELPTTKRFLQFLLEKDIDGILINSFAILELIKSKKLPFKVIIDSGLDIHNLAGIDFVNQFYSVNNINISQEVNIKNINKVKKYTKLPLSINSDNLPWLIEDIKKNKSINTIIIKGEFKSGKELQESASLIEKIVDRPKIFKNQKLPFKTPTNFVYETNHFCGEFVCSDGEDFEFSGHIKPFDWSYKRTRLKKVNENTKNLPKLCLRMSSLEQIKQLKKYINKLGFNPIYSIEYGEILSTSDLAKNSFNRILNIVKTFCKNNNIKLQISTPRVLIERDFDRVYEYVKQLFIEEPYPDSIIINNIGFWWSIANDSDYERISVELGQGLDLLNSTSILCLTNQKDVSAIDLSNFKNIANIKKCINKIKRHIPTIKLTVGGSVRIPCSGLCPLNNDSAILSRLSCTAPCHNKNYAIIDPSSNKVLPFAVDGFCRMHVFEDKILDLFNNLDNYKNIGVNEFIIDCNSLSANLIPILLNRFINSVHDHKYKPDSNFITHKYNIDQIF